MSNSYFYSVMTIVCFATAPVLSARDIFTRERGMIEADCTRFFLARLFPQWGELLGGSLLFYLDIFQHPFFAKTLGT